MRANVGICNVSRIDLASHHKRGAHDSKPFLPIVCQEHNRRPTGFHSKPNRGSLSFDHRVLKVTGTVACHPWLGADFHCRSVFIAAWSKYGFPVDVTIWMLVTFPCASNVNRKRPVPDCPGRDWPGGNDGAGA